MTRLAILVAIAFTIGGLLYGYSMRSLPNAARQALWKKYWTYLLLVTVVIGLGAAGGRWLGLLVGLISLVGATEITFARRQAITIGRNVPRWVWVPYAVVAVLAICGAILSTSQRVLFVFAVIATFDGTCQIIGQLFGRTKLSVVISPNKTAEGFAGGLIIAMAVAAYLSALFPAPPIFMAAAAVPMSLLALAGDLSTSWIKRQAGLKDYSGLIPGHGGVLDRFDGFLPNCALLSVVAACERLGV